MSRLRVIAVAALIAATPLGAAQAQTRVSADLLRLGVSGGIGLMQDRGRRADEQEAPRLMSEAQALSIAQRRAGGARFVGSLGLRGTTYVFRFERDGQIIDIAVDARGG